jgi:hypothetical protein
MVDSAHSHDNHNNSNEADPEHVVKLLTMAEQSVGGEGVARPLCGIQRT